MHDGRNVVHFLRRITPGPRPERTDEQTQVARASAGDREAIELLLSSNLAYVIHLAKEFRGRGLPFEDLIAEGCVGLLEAIRRYRAANGTRFMTYASFWVRKRLLAAMTDQPHTIHVPRYAREHGCEKIRVLRLDVPKTEDANRSLADGLSHPDPLPAETILRSEQHLAVRRHVLRLPLRDRTVIALRYGLAGQAPQTLTSIADRLGLSKERVRQIEVSALARLRDAITDPSSRRGWRRRALTSGRLDRIGVAGARVGT